MRVEPSVVHPLHTNNGVLEGAADNKVVEHAAIARGTVGRNEHPVDEVEPTRLKQGGGLDVPVTANDPRTRERADNLGRRLERARVVPNEANGVAQVDGSAMEPTRQHSADPREVQTVPKGRSDNAGVRQNARTAPSAERNPA